MTERRARGTSPAGRSDRRPSRSVRAKNASGAKRTETATAVSKSGAASKSSRSGGARAASGQSAAKRRTATRANAKPERRERKILGLSTGRAVLLAAVLAGLALTLAVPLRTYYTQRSDAGELATQHRQLEEEVANLRDRRAQQQDPNYIKAEARDRLRLVMPGETPYIVQIPEIEQPAIPAQPAKSREPDPWYTQLWNSVSSPQPVAAPAPPAPALPPPAPTEEGQPR
ncbi:FtsB family cell division protein [Nocardia aurantiaca]|uniref:Septum formation initiator family protein n=1 Tax=Nocardia aurantiaca TaxID=2675850 RepID=A0A6I3KZC4_9NOCA|nr:septum formation initiator family protein [Nocardia aurantiaca]MTE15412.1 septum formation initiator family protein [Nocardia aurantiaca]